MAAQAKGGGRAKRPGSPAKPAPANPPAPAKPSTPAGLRVAAAAQAVEAAGVCVAAVFAAVSTADGKSSHLATGVVLTVIAVCAAALLVCFAVGLARARPWSLIPVGMTQALIVVVGVTLVDGHRLEWGVPALLLAAVCLAGLLSPASLRALWRN